MKIRNKPPMKGIYKITSPTKRNYIGKSVNIYSRRNKYKNLKCQSQKRLYRSLLKYGWDSHTFEVIEECEVDMLNERERYWQDYYDATGKNGLNCVLTNTKDKKGLMSDETKKKISLANKGRKLNKTQIESMRSRLIGVKLTDEHKKNISKSLKGRVYKVSDEVRKMRSNFASSRFSKKIIDNNTGVIYNSAKEYSEKNILDYSRVRNMLNGNIKNIYNIQKYEE